MFDVKSELRAWRKALICDIRHGHRIICSFLDILTRVSPLFRGCQWHVHRLVMGRHFLFWKPAGKERECATIEGEWEALRASYGAGGSLSFLSLWRSA